jgi:hypothetical protein
MSAHRKTQHGSTGVAISRTVQEASLRVRAQPEVHVKFYADSKSCSVMRTIPGRSDRIEDTTTATTAPLNDNSPSTSDHYWLGHTANTESIARRETQKVQR